MERNEVIRDMEILSVSDFAAKYGKAEDVSRTISLMFNEFLKRGVAPYYSVDPKYQVEKPRYASLKHAFNAFSMAPLYQFLKTLDITESQLNDGTWLNLRVNEKGLASLTVSFCRFMEYGK